MLFLVDTITVLSNQYVSPLLVCMICRLPCRHSRCSGCCGMTCCLSCLKNVISQKTPCPHCPKNEMSVSATKFDYRDEEINALYVYCSNKESGCGWQGRVDNINDHLHNVDGCQFHEVPCPYNCGKMLQRQLVAVHVRNECLNFEIDCQYCHINEKRYLVSGEYKDVRPKFPPACPKKCGIGRVYVKTWKTTEQSVLLN